MIKRFALYLGPVAILLFFVVLQHRSTGIEIDGGFSSAVYSSSGDLLRLTLSGDEKYRQRVRLEEVPDNIVKAFLFKEDRYFYYHPGVNPISLLRAGYLSYFSNLGRYGASTITMQLVRLHRKIKTNYIGGKLKQLGFAFLYEALYSKDQILEAYLNLIPFGRNIEGIRAAGTIYLKKNLIQMDPIEHALLAVIPQRPQILNKHRFYAKAPLEIHKTRNDLLKKLDLENKGTHFHNLPIYLYAIEELPFMAPHLTTKLLSRKNEGDIKTTLNIKLQVLLDEKIKSFTQRQNVFGIKNAAALLVNTKTMEVEASVGSADFFNSEISGQVDGTSSKRSPGSTLKPFLYALAFEQGIVTPKSIVYDVPANFNSPANFDLDFLGPITIEEALYKSRNIPATDILRKLKKPDFYSFIKQIGISGVRSRGHYGSSLILGSMEFTMEELVVLYSMLANNGLLKELRYVKNKEIEEGIPVLSPEASVMTKIILGNTERPGYLGNKKILKSRKKIYWKTGTSFGLRDAWSIGLMDQYALAVWVGNFDSSSNPNFVGIKSAAPLFFEIFEGISHLTKPIWGANSLFASKLTEVSVCSASGKMPTKYCKDTTKTNFIPGVSPIHNCDVHRPIKVSKLTGLRSCDKLKEPTITKIVEHWPSQINELFRKKGIGKKLPPAYAPSCALGEQVVIGRKPVILSPKNGTSYPARIKKGIAEVPLKARADGDVKHLFWYIDQKYIGKFEVGKTVLSKLDPGYHRVKLVDDKGRSVSKGVNVYLVP